MATVLVALLGLTGLHSSLLMNTLAELAFIIACVSVIVVAWTLREFLDDSLSLLLGVALLFVAILHTVHLVDYPGLDLISEGLDPPTQLWLGARVLLAATFIAAPFVVGRRLNMRLVTACYATYTAALLAGIYVWQVFPATLTQSGLTSFKKGAEYIICGMFALAIALLARKRAQLPPNSFHLLVAALVASIVAELWFTLYRTEGSWPDLIGHLFLVLSALLLFRAVVDNGLARPHALVIGSLREAEDLHQRLELGLVPATSTKLKGVDVRIIHRPGLHQLRLGGDFIDALALGDEGLAVVCGDVSGHGPDAAALGAMLRASWQALSESRADPLVIVESLKRVLVRERRSHETFVTLSLAWIDPARDELRLMNFGHPPPLLLTDAVRPLQVPPMPPLGTVDRPLEAPRLLPLSDDWRLFFYTDGLVEGRLSPGSKERYGEQLLIERLQALCCERIDEARLEQLVSDIEAAGGEPFEDDVSLLLLSKTERVQPRAARAGCSP